MFDKNVLFFDLFFTLITPTYNDEQNEYDIIHMTKDEWETLAENEELYVERAMGRINKPLRIIEEIIQKGNIEVDEKLIVEILNLRERRMKKALLDVDKVIIDVLIELKRRNKKICLISNADMIDCLYWDESPLSCLFDEAVFSCHVGYVKPQKEIYKIALQKMGARPENCVFIGDGGSDEIKAAKQNGMTTILTEYLLERTSDQRVILHEHADYYIKDFADILDILP